MGLFDNVKANNKGTSALKTHLTGNRANEAGKPGEARKSYEEAMKQYIEAYNLGCRKPNVLHGYTILLMRFGEYEKARDLMLDTQKIKTLSPEDWYNLRVNYSICQWKLGNLDKAIESINRAIGDTKNSTIYTTLGMYLIEKAKITGEYKEALEFNREAMEYDDEDASVLDNMGQLYDAMSEAAEKQGDRDHAVSFHEKAVDFMEKAHKAKPRQITSIYYLAKLYHADGKNEEALKLLESARDLCYSGICAISKADMEALETSIRG